MRSTAWTVLLMVELSGIATSGARADELWRDVPPPAAAQRIADGERWLSLDSEALIARLAPLRGGESMPLRLPLPDGGDIAFEVQLAEAMAPELAEAHPEIRAWRGVASDGGLARLRMESTPLGIDAMIFHGDGDDIVMLMPDPGSGLHRSLSRARALRREAPACGVDHLMQAQREARRAIHPASATTHPSSVGANLRTYRTAIASTAEFTNANGGPNGALAVVVSAVNRINQIFENELGVRLQLVPDNDDLIFSDSTTDGYSDTGPGGSNGPLMQENQTRLDAIVGSANYDLGHVFATTGGGIAQVGVACLGDLKGQGVSGTAQVPGPIFFIDVVAHEIGHQLDARHTFNSSAGPCGPNRSADSAYEAGSGSTIMAYAGLCFDDQYEENVQFNAQPNFHVRSLEQIHEYTQSPAGNCGSLAATGNSAPLLDATPGFSIPARTPFLLTASATDAEGDSLTYAWDQYDLGPASPPLTDDGVRPLLRAGLPSSSPTRMVPRLADVLLGRGSPFDHSVGEVLPSTSRSLTFRAVVRDNHPGGGGVRWSGGQGAPPATTINVIDNDVGFGLSGFNTPEIVQPLVPVVVNWTIAGTQEPPISCPLVELAWSRDDGATFPLVLVASAENDGSETVSIPTPATTRGRLRIRCTSNIFFDINDAPITLRSENIAPVVQSVIRLDPTPALRSPVRFQLLFSEEVSGLGVTDLAPAASGTLQAAVESIEGSGAFYIVHVSIAGATGGTLELNVLDDDTIRDTSGNALGGTGIGNGLYAAGESYTIPANTFVQIMRDGFEAP